MSSVRFPSLLRRRSFGSLLVGALGSLLLLGARDSGAGQPELLVIVNVQNSAARLGTSELRPIFQTSKKKWDNGALVEPVNLPEKSAPRQQFDRAVLGYDPETALRYWIDRKVRGEARPPKKLNTAAAVVSHVANAPGGIGYVPADSSLNGRVKIVARVSGEQVKAP